MSSFNSRMQTSNWVLGDEIGYLSWHDLTDLAMVAVLTSCVIQHNMWEPFSHVD